MKLKEFYDAIGGGYEAIKQRIPKDDMIEKFVLRFLSEPTYENLCRRIENEEYEEAFRAVHSLKGISANLGFQRLEKSSGILTELLRNSSAEEIDKNVVNQMLEQITIDYNIVIETIGDFANS